MSATSCTSSRQRLMESQASPLGSSVPDSGLCSQAHQSLLTLPPSIWWAAVATPQWKEGGKTSSFSVLATEAQGSGGDRRCSDSDTDRVTACEDGSMSESLKFLVSLLDLEPIEVNIFRGAQLDEERQRVFGGQVAGQALMAAGRTVEHGRVHSLHSYFLRPGDPTVPILYEVDRIRDGRSFTTRRVVAIQHGRAIYNMEASFHDLEDEQHHATSSRCPRCPTPTHCRRCGNGSSPTERNGRSGSRSRIRSTSATSATCPGTTRCAAGPYHRLWIRADGELPDDPLLHACVITYASDMSLFDTVLMPHTVSWDDPDFMGASLDHCMWFHRPIRADHWMLYDMDSPAAAGGRGLARGFLYNQEGELCVSLAQEGLARLVTDQARG